MKRALLMMATVATSYDNYPSERGFYSPESKRVSRVIMLADRRHECA
jgi:hypothetical protein